MRTTESCARDDVHTGCHSILEAFGPVCSLGLVRDMISCKLSSDMATPYRGRVLQG